MTRTRISAYTGKVSPACNHSENGKPCTNAQFARGYCFRHQRKRRRQLAAQFRFFSLANHHGATKP